MGKNKTYSGKEVTIIVIVIIAGIALAETSLPMWTLGFWREFIVKFLTYCGVSAFVLIVLAVLGSSWSHWSK